MAASDWILEQNHFSQQVAPNGLTIKTDKSAGAVAATTTATLAVMVCVIVTRATTSGLSREDARKINEIARLASEQIKSTFGLLCLCQFC